MRFLQHYFRFCILIFAWEDLRRKLSQNVIVFLQHVYEAKALVIEFYPKMLSTNHIARFFQSALFPEAISSSAIFKFVSILHSHKKCTKVLLSFGTVRYFISIQFS